MSIKLPIEKIKVFNERDSGKQEDQLTHLPGGEEIPIEFVFNPYPLDDRELYNLLLRRRHKRRVAKRRKSK